MQLPPVLSGTPAGCLEQSKSSRIPIREQLKKAAEQLVKEPPKTQERTKEVVREER